MRACVHLCACKCVYLHQIWFHASFFTFSISGWLPTAKCVCSCTCGGRKKKKKKSGVVSGQKQPLRAVWCKTRLLNSGCQFDQSWNLFSRTILAHKNFLSLRLCDGHTQGLRRARLFRICDGHVQGPRSKVCAWFVLNTDLLRHLEKSIKFIYEQGTVYRHTKDTSKVSKQMWVQSLKSRIAYDLRNCTKLFLYAIISRVQNLLTSGCQLPTSTFKLFQHCGQNKSHHQGMTNGPESAKVYLRGKIRNRVLLPKNNHLHSPENDAEYFLKSESELFKCERQCKFRFSLLTCAVNFFNRYLSRDFWKFCVAPKVQVRRLETKYVLGGHDNI